MNSMQANMLRPCNMHQDMRPHIIHRYYEVMMFRLQRKCLLVWLLSFLLCSSSSVSECGGFFLFLLLQLNAFLFVWLHMHCIFEWCVQAKLLFLYVSPQPILCCVHNAVNRCAWPFSLVVFNMLWCRVCARLRLCENPSYLVVFRSHTLYA